MKFVPSYVHAGVGSAWMSKINWAAAGAALLTLGTSLGLPISEEMKVQILTIIGVGAPLIIGVLRTWFTTTMTPASAVVSAP